MQIERIDTPALVIDRDKLEKNMLTMQRLTEEKGISLRPHYKSHKCAELARMQIEMGAVGMTCAKLSEAIDLADAGIEDILIANQIVDKKRIARVAELAKDCKLTLCVDDAHNVDELSAAATAAGSEIGVLVEYEIGMNRCGVATHKEVRALAEQITRAPGLRFEGLQAYAGHMSHEPDEAVRRKESERSGADLKRLIEELEADGITVRTLSGGSTGTSLIKAEDRLYTELQAGSYLFMDATYRHLGLPFLNSLFILTTVLSVKDGLAVVDAGVKSCGIDQGMPIPVGFTAERIEACEEHFQIFSPDKNFAVGDKVLLMPAHCCSTVNLYDKMYLVKDKKVSARLSVSARGLSQ